MKEDMVAAVVAGSFVDPETGAAVSVPTRSVVIEKNLDGMEQELVKALGFGRRLAVVSDIDTWNVLANRVEKALKPVFEIISIVLPRRPHPDMETVENIKNESRAADGLIAVGSGTINDLCKYSASQDDKPYAVFGTAPSMNGYTSVNASITINGMKNTLSAAGAKGVFLDLSVLSKAPKRMIRSGLGDSVCRSTAQADWMLARLLRGASYRNLPFLLLKEDEAELMAESAALLSGDPDAMQRLARTLTLSGFGMTICGGSQPASQGEHLISHYVEMMGDRAWPEMFHGEQIGVTTLTMARLQERILNNEPPRVRPTSIGSSDVIAHFGNNVGTACWEEFSPKRLDERTAEAMNARLRANWESIRRHIIAVMCPESTLRDALRRAGAPVTPEDLHWPTDFYRHAVQHAREIRNRFTFLDLAGDCGFFDDGNTF